MTDTIDTQKAPPLDVAIQECEVLGLHPIHDPLGDDHHTDVPFSAEDDKIGSALAYFLGSCYCDVVTDEKAAGKFFYRQSTSINEWRRIARALRIHGLKITDKDAPPCTHATA